MNLTPRARIRHGCIIPPPSANAMFVVVGHKGFRETPETFVNPPSARTVPAPSKEAA